VEEIVDQQFTVPIDLTIDESALSPQQKHLMARALRGESVFFTGPAGTGKSVLLRGIIRALFFRDKPGFNSRVAVTASTGMAAL
jgi:ATP-dependent DNA helicase PIF1